MRRGRDKCASLSRAQSTEVQAACRRATKSVCVVTASRYINSLRLPQKKKKSNSGKSGDRGGIRTIPTDSIPAAGECHIQPITYRSTEIRRSPNMQHH
ncbi:hypothetical protein TNCV_4581671 [Trichonephila clavipes]|nr:hypothetical protein TNCV_4581671 [Trichonephila clavipes]